MDTPTTDPAADERALRARGFSAAQAARLVALRDRRRGAFRAATPSDRLRFARYLVERGWLGEWGRSPRPDAPQP